MKNRKQGQAEISPQADASFMSLPYDLFTLIALQIKDLTTLQLVCNTFKAYIDEFASYALSAATRILIQLSTEHADVSTSSSSVSGNVEVKTRGLLSKLDYYRPILMKWKKTPLQDHAEVKQNFMPILEFAVANLPYTKFCFKLIQLNLSPNFLTPNHFGLKTTEEAKKDLEAHLLELGFKLKDGYKLSYEKSKLKGKIPENISKEEMAKLFFEVLSATDIMSSHFIKPLLERCVHYYQNEKPFTALLCSMRATLNIRSHQRFSELNQNAFINAAGLCILERNIENCFLNYAVFNNCHFRAVSLFKLSGANIEFRNSNFNQVEFNHSDCRYGDFSNVMFYKVKFWKVILLGACFGSSRLYEFNLNECDLSHTDWRNIQFKPIFFEAWLGCQWGGVTADFANIVQSDSELGYTFLYHQAGRKMDHDAICSSISFIFLAWFSIQKDLMIKQFNLGQRDNAKMGNNILLCLNLFLMICEDSFDFDIIDLLTALGEELIPNTAEACSLIELITGLTSVSLKAYKASDGAKEKNSDIRDYVKAQFNRVIDAKPPQKMEAFSSQPILRERHRQSLLDKNAQMFPSQSIRVTHVNMGDMIPGNMAGMGNMGNMIPGNMAGMGNMGNMIPGNRAGMGNMGNFRFFSYQGVVADDLELTEGSNNHFDDQNVPVQATQGQTQDHLNVDQENKAEESSSEDHAPETNDSDVDDLDDESFEHRDKKARTGDYSFNPRP